MNQEKANQFNSHNTVSALIYWNNINIQIKLRVRYLKQQMILIKNIFRKEILKRILWQ